MTASQMKKLHFDKARYLQHFDELPSVLRDLRQYRLLDTERIVYRLYLGEGMSVLGAKAP